MDILPKFILIFFLVIINAFFSCTEIAIISVNKAKLKTLIDNGNKKAKKLLEVIQSPNKLLSTIQIAITLASLLASASAAVTIADKITFLPQQLAVIITTLLLAYISLVFGELVPKRIGLQYSLIISLNVVWILEFLSIVFTPIIYILSASTNLILFLLRVNKNQNDDNLSKEEMLSILSTSKLQEVEKEFLENIIEFDEKLAREVMIPRPSIFAVSKNNTINDLLKIENITRYSRIPVYDNDLDDIIGILHLKDLIVIENKDLLVEEFMKTPTFFPDTKKINELFLEMKNNNLHICILIDEYGGVSGIVTLEDLLEEIVGNITDEYDKKIYDVVELGKNKYLVNGELSINDLNDYLKTDFSSEYYDSIAGLIIEKIGYIPEDNKKVDEINIDNYTFKVQKVRNKKIIKILITHKGDNNV